MSERNLNWSINKRAVQYYLQTLGPTVIIILLLVVCCLLAFYSWWKILCWGKYFVSDYLTRLAPDLTEDDDSLDEQKPVVV